MRKCHLKRIVASVICLSMITASVFGDSNLAATKKVKLSKTSIKLEKGKTFRLKVKNYKGKVRWKSSAKKIASVSKKGIVKAKKNGKAKIFAYTSVKKLKCNVKVIKKKKSKLNLGDKTTNNPQPKTIADAILLLSFFFSTNLFTNGFREQARTYDAKNIIAISEFLKTKIINNIESSINTIFFGEI